MLTDTGITALDDGTWRAEGARPDRSSGVVARPAISITSIDRLLSWNVLPVPAMASMTIGGDTLPVERYSRVLMSSPHGSEPVVRVLHLDRAIDELASGATLALVGLQHMLPEVEAYLREFGQRCGAACTANLYLSGPGAEGGLHHDFHDVVVVQLAGTKDWDLYQPPAGWTDDATTGRAGESVGALRLEVGDALHVPPGWPHRVSTPAGGWSMHLTVGLRPRSSVAGGLGRSYGGPPESRLAALAGQPVAAVGARLVPRNLPWVREPHSDGERVAACGRSVDVAPGAGAVLDELAAGTTVGVDRIRSSLGREPASDLVQGLVAAGLVRIARPAP